MEDTLVMEFIKSLSEAKLHRHMSFDGLDISIEVPADGYRRGKNKRTGEEWAIKVPAHYGYIKGTHSPDGEHLDCYVRKNPKKGSKVYVMHQMTVDGSRFDEDKVMLGYTNKNEAIRAFKSVTFKPTVMYGGCTEFEMEHFQVMAFSASTSHAMLTSRETFSDFKKRGLLGKTIKSPIMVARKVSESLAEGLGEIATELSKGDIQECLEWGGLDEGADVETLLTLAYNHYAGTPYMHDHGIMSEEVFRDTALNHIMENDALVTDTIDEVASLDIDEDLVEEIRDDYDHDLNPTVDESLEQIEEEPIMEANNFVVVVHTQIMENIGSAVNPSWATAGTKTVLVQEGFADYGAARSVAAQVSAGILPVKLAEGAYVLGIDVMPTGEYRQFHEDDNAEPVEETVEEETTDEVFFQQQVMETQRLAGVQQGTYVNKGTPTVHETRARLEALSKGYFEAVAEEAQELEESLDALPLTESQLSQAAKILESTIVLNPGVSNLSAAKAVCKKLYGDTTLAETVLKAWEHR
jgi:hypothetical protein